MDAKIRPQQATASPRPAPSPAARAVVFLLFFALFVALALRIAPPMARQAATASWPKAVATVTRSQVISAASPKHPMKLQFEFRFETPAGETIYASQRTQGFVARPMVGLRAFAETHHHGTILTIWYNPADPTRTTLAPGLGIAEVLIGGGLLAFFGFASLVAARAWFRAAMGTGGAGRGVTHETGGYVRGYARPSRRA